MVKQYELSELIALMKTEKVLSVKMGGLEVVLSPLAYVKPEELTATSKPEPMPNEDELLRWSVPGAFMEPEEVATVNV